MAGSPKKRERKARTVKLFASAGFMDALCARIAATETLPDICKDLDIKYLDVMAWVSADETRTKRYAAAIELRKNHQQELVLRELQAALSADIADAFDEQGQVKKLTDIPVALRRCMAGIETNELFGQGADGLGQIGTVKKLKLWDKPRQIEMLAKHLKMLVEKHEVTTTNTTVSVEVKQLADVLSPEELLAIRERILTRQADHARTGGAGAPPAEAE